MADQCTECGQPLPGAQLRAMEARIAQMRFDGEITGQREVQAAMLIGMAAAVDANPDRGALWREMRIAEAAFRNGAGNGAEDEFDRLAAALSADVGDAAI